MSVIKCCSVCKSVNIETKTWINVNTKVVGALADSMSHDSEDNWCEDCENHCYIKDK